jgi:thioredoxin 1
LKKFPHKVFALIGFVLMIAMFLACNAWKHSSVFSYEELRAKAFEQKLTTTTDYILVDVRTPKEYEKGHIQNAVNISYFGNDFSAKVDELPKDKLIFMYCQTQHRSPLASKLMKKKGFTRIIDLSGGFMKWEKNKLPIIK